MKLRLAEYKDGKFERFLELGKDFLYGGDFIIFTRSSGYFFIDTACQEYREQFKDQKDPLNRFNGLFDGRTYGDGKFVLIVDNNHDIYCGVPKSDYNERLIFVNDPETYRDVEWYSCDAIGNLHENPELFLKI
jgi:hypothetical protein